MASKPEETQICALNIINMAITQQQTIRHYLQGLETGNAAQIIKLFSEYGRVHSPLYGTQQARNFYKALFQDTLRSEIRLFHIFQEVEKPGVAGVHFQYDWLMRDGSANSFECVDIFHFTGDDKIRELRIIYDTQNTRLAFNQLR